jgi:hypothetical protein
MVNVKKTILTSFLLTGGISLFISCGGSSGSSGRSGDLNRDGKVDRNDFSLVASMNRFNQTATPDQGDVNNDGIFDILDVAIMLAGVDDSGSAVGDANRDGTVDALDVSQVMAAGKFATGQAAKWEDGDFDGDGRVTDDDMSMLQAAFKQFANPVMGDCTGDGKADGADIGKFLVKYDKFNSPTATWLDCDFNKDGLVDVTDASGIATKEISIDNQPPVPLVFANVSYGPQRDLSSLSNPPPRYGDLNLDGKVNETDALLITASGKYDKGKVGAVLSDGDANADGAVDILDVAIVLANMDPWTKKAGDANNDGKIDINDVAQILAAGKYENGQRATFAEGDFNGDGIFDILDWSMVLASGAKFE